MNVTTYVIVIGIQNVPVNLYPLHLNPLLSPLLKPTGSYLIQMDPVMSLQLYYSCSTSPGSNCIHYQFNSMLGPEVIRMLSHFIANQWRNALEELQVTNAMDKVGSAVYQLLL